MSRQSDDQILIRDGGGCHTPVFHCTLRAKNAFCDVYPVTDIIFIVNLSFRSKTKRISWFQSAIKTLNINFAFTAWINTREKRCLVTRMDKYSSLTSDIISSRYFTVCSEQRIDVMRFSSVRLAVVSVVLRLQPSLLR